MLVDCLAYLLKKKKLALGSFKGFPPWIHNHSSHYQPECFPTSPQAVITSRDLDTGLFCVRARIQNALLFFGKRDPRFFFSTPFCTDLVFWLLSKRIKDSGSIQGGNGCLAGQGTQGKSETVRWKSHKELPLLCFRQFYKLRSLFNPGSSYSDMLGGMCITYIESNCSLE